MNKINEEEIFLNYGIKKKKYKSLDKKYNMYILYIDLNFIKLEDFIKIKNRILEKNTIKKIFFLKSSNKIKVIYLDKKFLQTIRIDYYLEFTKIGIKKATDLELI